MLSELLVTVSGIRVVVISLEDLHEHRCIPRRFPVFVMFAFSLCGYYRPQSLLGGSDQLDLVYRRVFHTTRWSGVEGVAR